MNKCAFLGPTSVGPKKALKIFFTYSGEEFNTQKVHLHYKLGHFFTLP